MGDLLIVGPGRLGLLVAGLWRQRLQQLPQEEAGSGVHLKFRSENVERSRQMEQQGYIVLPPNNGGSDPAPAEEGKFSRVVFCAPPTGNDNYAADVEQARRYCRDDGGLFVFTSSGSVYAENGGGTVNEEAAVARTPRTGKIIDAEAVVLSGDGCVLRLGGLYAADIGVHNYFARGGEVPALPSGLINLLHYEDAAEAVLAALDRPAEARGQVFLVSDGVPLTRQQIAVAASGGSSQVVFTGGGGVDGKVYDTSKICQRLEWRPKHSSFTSFMESL